MLSARILKAGSKKLSYMTISAFDKGPFSQMYFLIATKPEVFTPKVVELIAAQVYYNLQIVAFGVALSDDWAMISVD